jgi:hypothetical protein
VAYRVFNSDTRCRTRHLEITVDVNDDTLSGASTIAPVRRSQDTVTVDVPPDLTKADVIRATARTRDGYPSKAASVLIR